MWEFNYQEFIFIYYLNCERSVCNRCCGIVFIENLNSVLIIQQLFGGDHNFHDCWGFWFDPV